MKTCNLCGTEKEFKEFNKFSRSKDGHRSDCRECQKLNRKKYDEKYKGTEGHKKSLDKYKSKNKEKLRADSLSYYYSKKDDTEYIEKRKRREKNYRSKNKDKISENYKKYCHDNSDKIKQYKKTYRISNREKINEYQRNYFDIRLKNDNLFKLSHYTRSIIRKSLLRGGYSIKSKTQDILGCSYGEFKEYIESKFEPWMSWDNYGLYNGDFNYGWDIDHIIPLSSAVDELEIIKLNHYTNLQPLCSKTNRDIKRHYIMDLNF